MVLVPLLIKFGKLEDKKAFSSAISIILPMCLVSIAVYWTRQVFPVKEALPCSMENGEPFVMGINNAKPMYWGLVFD